MAEELVTKSGFIDFDSRNPLLEEEDGAVWRLEGEVAIKILLGSEVVLTGVRTGASTIEVRSFEALDESD